jgi:hypothetical protein
MHSVSTTWLGNVTMLPIGASRATGPAQLAPLHARVLVGQAVPTRRGMGEAEFRPMTPPGRPCETFAVSTRAAWEV